MHYHPTHCLDQEAVESHSLGPPRGYLGIFSCHLPGNSTLLPAGSLFVLVNLYPQAASEMILTCRLGTPALILSGEGECAPVDVFLIIAHTATVSTILTDMALVVVPAIILWNTQMKRQAKI